MDVQDLSFLGQVLFVALGIAASVLIPVLWAARPKATAVDGFWSRLWKLAKPYLALSIVSVLMALIVLAIFAAQGKSLTKWWEALLAGYVADSTLQKFRESQ
jgi:hypothetical protein